MSDEAAKGDKAFKKAKDFTQSSITSFRFKPDWDQTARWAKEAATAYMRAGAGYADKHREALLLSSTAHENINAWNQAATDMQTYAEMSAKASGVKLDDVLKAFRASSRLFRLNQQVERAAAVLMKAADVAQDQKVCQETPFSRPKGYHPPFCVCGARFACLSVDAPPAPPCSSVALFARPPPPLPPASHRAPTTAAR